MYFEATFVAEPTPFNINVNKDFIDETKLRVSLTRLAKEIDQPDWTEGPPVGFASRVKEYWTTQYDWFKVQAELNDSYITSSYVRVQFTDWPKVWPNIPRPFKSTVLLAIQDQFRCTSFTEDPSARMPYHFFSFMDGRARVSKLSH